jgi:hypothetical protein
MAMSTSSCAADRVMLAGGALNTLLVDPQITYFEQLFRALPEEGMFHATVSPERPFRFTIGAFRPQRTQAMVLFDLRPDIYRFSGIDAGDALPFEERRFANAMGFDLTVDGSRSYARMEFQLEPVPIDHAGSIAFQPAEGGSDLFSGTGVARAESAGTVAGSGMALQPQRPHRPGAQSLPFNIIVRPNQTFQIQVVVFHPLQTPVAFVEYGIAGILMPELILDNLLRCMKPLAMLP